MKALDHPYRYCYSIRLRSWGSRRPPTQFDDIWAPNAEDAIRQAREQMHDPRAELMSLKKMPQPYRLRRNNEIAKQRVFFGFVHALAELAKKEKRSSRKIKTA